MVAKVQSQRRSHLLRNVRNTPTRTYYKYLSIPTEELNSTSNAYDTEYRTLVYSTVNFYTTTNNYIVSSTYNFPSSTITRKPDYTSLSLYAAVSDYTPVSHYKLRLHSHLFKRLPLSTHMTNESSDYNNYCLEDLFVNSPRTTYPSAHYASIDEILLNDEDSPTDPDSPEPDFV